MKRRQKTATIQDEDGCYRAARSGDTFTDPDGNWMIAVPAEVTNEEGSHEHSEVSGCPPSIPVTSGQGQVQVH